MQTKKSNYFKLIISYSRRNNSENKDFTDEVNYIIKGINQNISSLNNDIKNLKSDFEAHSKHEYVKLGKFSMILINY